MPRMPWVGTKARECWLFLWDKWYLPSLPHHDGDDDDDDDDDDGDDDDDVDDDDT